VLIFIILRFWAKAGDPESVHATFPATCITPNQCFSMEIPRILKIMKMGDFREKCENEQKVRLFAKKRTFPARGGNPSIAQHILMVLGAQSALWGKKCVFHENDEIS